MRYAWCFVALAATVIWIHGIWTNSLDVVSKSLVSGVLAISLLDFYFKEWRRRR